MEKVWEKGGFARKQHVEFVDSLGEFEFFRTLYM